MFVPLHLPHWKTVYPESLVEKTTTMICLQSDVQFMGQLKAGCCPAENQAEWAERPDKPRNALLITEKQRLHCDRRKPKHWWYLMAELIQYLCFQVQTMWLGGYWFGLLVMGSQKMEWDTSMFYNRINTISGCLDGPYAPGKINNTCQKWH